MKIFGINFAIGVATGIILEFEFGTNWVTIPGLSETFSSSPGHRRYHGLLYGEYLYCNYVLWLG